MSLKKITVTKNKTFLVFLTIVFIGLAQPSRADLDPQGLSATVLSGVGALSVFMGLATGTALAVTGGIPLGVLGAILYVTNNTSSSSASTSTGIQITLDPNKPLITPVGWVDSTTPPNTVNKEQLPNWSNGSTGGYATSKSAIDAYVALLESNNPDNNYTPLYDLVRETPEGDPNNDYYNTTIQNYYIPTGTTSNITRQLTVSVACPSGSTQATLDTCTVTNPAQIPKPKKGIMEIKRTGNTFAIDPQANSADILPSSIVNVTASKVTINDSNGSKTTIEILNDGSTIINTSKPNTSTGKTETTTTKLDPPTGGNAPAVSGTAQGSIDGTGSLQSSGGGGDSIDVSGLNQEGTQGQVLSTLQDIKNAQCGGTGQPPCQTKIDETGTEEVKNGVEDAHAGRLGTIDGFYDEIEDIAQNQTGGVGTGFSTPITDLIPTGGSCVNPSFDARSIASGAYVVLPLCEHANEVQPLLTWAMSLFTIAGIWGLMFTKVGGT